MRSSRSAGASASDACVCGHSREAHTHYRRGTECAICDVRTCSAFTPMGLGDRVAGAAEEERRTDTGVVAVIKQVLRPRGDR